MVDSFWLSVSEWPNHAQASRPDLAGYFNDTKLDLAAKSAQPEWIKLMDYLEYSERDGGLTGWLDRWAETMAAPNFNDMAKIAGEVATAVDYNKTLVGDFLQAPMHRDDAALQAQGQELLSLLGSVAAEVARQTDAVLTNGMQPLRTGERTAAVRESFRRISEPQARAHEIRTDVRERMVAERFAVGRGGLDGIVQKDLSNCLRDWQRTAMDMDYLLQRIQSEPTEAFMEQQDYANAFRDAANRLSDVIDAATKKCVGVGRNAELFLRDLGEIVDAFQDVNTSTSPQLNDDVAQKILSDANGALSDHRKKIDAVLAGVNPLHVAALDAARKGTLRDFWGSRRDELIGMIGDKSRKQELNDIFKGSLGPTLDKWSGANTADKYGLAWQLAATLRSYSGATSRSSMDSGTTRRGWLVPLGRIEGDADQPLDPICVTLGSAGHCRLLEGTGHEVWPRAGRRSWPTPGPALGRSND